MKLLPGKAVPSEVLLTEVCQAKLREQNAELEKARGELNRLRPLQESQINGFVKLLREAWLTQSSGRVGRVFFDDPVWGHNCVDEELSPLFFQPLVQRLNYIKQLSFAYLTFPNATHSRLAHSLGTCRNLEASLSTIFRNNILYTSTGKQPIDLAPEVRRNLILKAKAAALLHDVGHAPFGHALDKLVGYFDATRPLSQPDKYYSRRYAEQYLSPKLPECAKVENLCTILGQDRTGLSGWDTLIADLLDSSLDVDRMDFLVRDAHMTGLSMGVTGIEALIERMCPFLDGKDVFLTFDESCIPYIDDFLLAREKMYALCYEHPSKLAAERIFTRLMESLIRDYRLKLDVLMLLTDEQALALLGIAAIGSEENRSLLNALLQNLEYTTVLEVDLRETNPLIEHWKKSRDSSRMAHWAYVEASSEWERNIAAGAGLKDKSWRILVTIPDQKTGVPNECAAQILKRKGTGYRIVSLFEAYPKLRDRLKDEHIPRGKIRVFADSHLSDLEKAEVQRAAAELLRAP